MTTPDHTDELRMLDLGALLNQPMPPQNPQAIQAAWENTEAAATTSQTSGHIVVHLLTWLAAEQMYQMATGQCSLSALPPWPPAATGRPPCEQLLALCQHMAVQRRQARNLPPIPAGSRHH